MLKKTHSPLSSPDLIHRLGPPRFSTVLRAFVVVAEAVDQVLLVSRSAEVPAPGLGDEIGLAPGAVVHLYVYSSFYSNCLLFFGKL